MENLCNFYRFQSLARLLIPRVFVFQRLCSFQPARFSLPPAPRFCFSAPLVLQQARFSLPSRAPFLFQPCVFLFSTLPVLLYGSYALSNTRAFLYRPAPRIVFPLFPHTVGMKLTTHVCCFLLIFFGLCAAVYALTGFPLLYFLCFSNATVFRAVLSLAGVAAGWLLFWLIAFRPTAQLS